MSHDSSALLRRGLWTVGTFGGSFALKLGSNVVLSRLLAPEIFGVMVIVNSIRLGVELLTDVGVEQNIVHHRRGLDPAFFNTAWTIQILRGLMLSLVFLAFAAPLSLFYHVDLRVFLVIALAPFANSLASTSIFGLVKTLQVRQRNVFELASETLGFCIVVIFALITPTVWALVFGAIASISTRSAMSYFLPHPAHQLTLEREAMRNILHFGKWIMVLSLVGFAAMNADRIYLGKVLPLRLLGIYGLARTIAELPTTLAGRLSYQIVFPTLAAAASGPGPRGSDRTDLGAVRAKFILCVAACLASLMAWSDWAIRLLYDPRYQSAGWMLFALLAATWLSVLASLNEGLVLGAGKPAFNSAANVVRLGFLLVGLPAGYAAAGLTGAIVALFTAELARYACVAVGQHFVRHSFWRQDAAGTVFGLALLLCWLALRRGLNVGMPWTGWGH